MTLFSSLHFCRTEFPSVGRKTTEALRHGDSRGRWIPASEPSLTEVKTALANQDTTKTGNTGKTNTRTMTKTDHQDPAKSRTKAWYPRPETVEAARRPSPGGLKTNRTRHECHVAAVLNHLHLNLIELWAQMIGPPLRCVEMLLKMSLVSMKYLDGLHVR